MTDFDRAVEAMTTLWPKGNPTQIEAQALLSAALPHLDRHFRRVLSEELRRDAGEGQTIAAIGLRFAADHLEGK